jgi:hypothetical protein
MVFAKDFTRIRSSLNANDYSTGLGNVHLA